MRLSQVRKERTFEHRMNLSKAIRGEIEYSVNDSGCFVVFSHKISDNMKYPRISILGKRFILHRYVYEIFNNRKLLDDEVIMHICDNTRCINPAHLRAVQQIVNLRDAVIKNRNAWGEKQHLAKLTEDQVIEIYSEPRSKGVNNNKLLARKYGVCATTISNIKTKKIWTHLTVDGVRNFDN